MTLLHNKKLIADRFSARLDTYNKLAQVQSSICDIISERMYQVVDVEVNRAIEVGAGTGFLTSHLLRRFGDAHWTINDIVERTKPFIDKCAAEAEAHHVDFLCCDAETGLPDEMFDLIASASAIQWFDDIEGFIRRLYGKTKSGGYVVLSTFSSDNFFEINKATGENGLQYPTLDEIISQALKSGFCVAHSEEFYKKLSFDSPIEVLRHMKYTGVNSVRETFWTKKLLEEFCSRYSEFFSNEDGSVTLTYHPIIIILKRQ